MDTNFYRKFLESHQKVRKTVKSAVDILIINLAAADCLYCFGLPIWAHDAIQLRKWKLGTAFQSLTLSRQNWKFLATFQSILWKSVKVYQPARCCRPFRYWTCTDLSTFYHLCRLVSQINCTHCIITGEIGFDSKRL